MASTANPREMGQSVLLVAMPWASARFPCLGISTLKAVLNRDGVACEVKNLNCDFAHQIGVDLYSFIAGVLGGDHRGECFFTSSYFDLDPVDFARLRLRPHCRRMLKAADDLKGFPRGFPEAALLDRCEELSFREVPRFLTRCAEEVDWRRYDIIGFSLMFNQTLSSLCLARWIKDRFPEKTIIFGGPSCDGVMGLEMLRSFPPIDIVALGESDRVISPLVKAVRGEFPLDEVPGIAFRRGNELVQTSPVELLTDLDWLPRPDFSDYFAQTRGWDGCGEELIFESSRGCWWGAKSLCTFCGLNGVNLAFRRKSPERVVDEILTLSEVHGVAKFQASDNILDVAYFKTVLPAIRDLNRSRGQEARLSFFYEIKSNLGREQLELMVAAGFGELQPGIESFSDGVLARMKKGTSGIQQMQLVKWATELGLKIVYGIIHSNPNDTVEDYRDMEEQVDFLCHLIPPSYFTPMFLERFSGYWLAPEEHGIREIRPFEGYATVFPDPGIDLGQLAYRFEFDHADRHNPELASAIESCVARLRRWRDEFIPDSLVYEEQDGEVFVWDRRGRNEVTPASLTGVQASVFLNCDRFTTARSLAQKLAWSGDLEIEAALDFLIERKWLYRDTKGRCLSLPVRRDRKTTTDAGSALATQHEPVGESREPIPRLEDRGL